LPDVTTMISVKVRVSVIRVLLSMVVGSRLSVAG